MPLDNAALVIIDVQKAIDHPSWGKRNNLDAERKIAMLLESWRKTCRPVFHIRHVSRDPHSTYRPDHEGVDFKDIVQPLPGETVVTKHTNSAFIGTNLGDLFRAQSIDTIVVCGVITNNSVEATARMGGNLGYDTYVISDATATFDKPDFDGRARTAQEVHAMSLANLQGEYATVIAAADLLTLMERPNSTLQPTPESGRG